MSTSSTKRTLRLWPTAVLRPRVAWRLLGSGFVSSHFPVLKMLKSALLMRTYANILTPRRYINRTGAGPLQEASHHALATQPSARRCIKNDARHGGLHGGAAHSMASSPEHRRLAVGPRGRRPESGVPAGGPAVGWVYAFALTRPTGHPCAAQRNPLPVRNRYSTRDTKDRGVWHVRRAGKHVSA